MRLRSSILVAIGLVFALSGCDLVKGLTKGKDKSSAEETAESDEPKKDKKKKKKKAKEEDEEEEVASAKPSASAPTTPTPSENPLATALLGPTTATFLRQKNVKDFPVWAQILPDWKTSRDDSGTDYLDGELYVSSPKHAENHVVIYMSVDPKMSGPDLGKLSFDCQRVSASDCKLDGEPIDGKLGAPPGLPAKIAKGTATKFRGPGELYYVVADLPNGKSLKLIATLKKDVYPKLEGQLMETLKSIKWQQ